MTRPTIPPDVNGYMVTDGIVHTRYATHVPRGHRARTLDGVYGLLRGAHFSVCIECYPPPEKPKRHTRRQTSEAPAFRYQPRIEE